MKWKYLFGSVACNAYRLLHIFPNSDPLMGFVLPAAKNEKIWKAPLFAFFTMASFDLITGKLGVWTLVTSTTYALVSLLIILEMKKRKTSIGLFLSRGAFGILLFDTVTGPLMSSIVFRQDIIVTSFLQIPFTIMHLISATFAILIITPLLDVQIMKELRSYLHGAKSAIMDIARAFS